MWTYPLFSDTFFYVLKTSHKKCVSLAKKLLNTLMKSGKLSYGLKYIRISGIYKTHRDKEN